ncbi:MAG TPA: GNAT family N-acetyltransferase [Candidatus Eremiobacteraceae bacterium]
MIIRSPETAEDLFAVAPLFDAYRVFYKAASDPASARKFLFDRWRLRESVLFIAYDGVKPQGFVQLYPIFASVEMRRLWLLNDLFVADATRRAGIGRALMRRAEQHARETSAIGLTLSTALENARAQQLYETERYVRDSVFCVYNRIL